MSRNCCSTFWPKVSNTRAALWYDVLCSKISFYTQEDCSYSLNVLHDTNSWKWNISSKPYSLLGYLLISSLQLFSTAGSVEVIWSSPHLERLLSLHALVGRIGEWQSGRRGLGRGLRVNREGCLKLWWSNVESTSIRFFHSEVPACHCEHDHHSFWQYLVFREIDLNWMVFRCVLLKVTPSPAKSHIRAKADRTEECIVLLINNWAQQLTCSMLIVFYISANLHWLWCDYRYWIFNLNVMRFAPIQKETGRPFGNKTCKNTCALRILSNMCWLSDVLPVNG